MEQKQRDKIAWVLAVVLGLVLIYLLAVNVFKPGKKSPPRSRAAMTQALPVVQTPPAAVGGRDANRTPPALAPEALAEQRRIAARLPPRNPFGAAEGGREPAQRVRSVDAGAKDGGYRSPAGSGPAHGELKLKVTAIMSRPGSNKRIAMINGRMLEEGDRLDDWIIMKVNPGNVILSNGARQMVVGVK